MKRLSLLIKPSSSKCNLSCKYCFYNDIASIRKVDDYGFMSISTAKKIIDNTFANLDDGDEIELAFQGGEPTLVGIDFYKEFIEYVNSKNIGLRAIKYSIQTNGILIDDKWCRLFQDNNFLVGLSLDGPERFHNRNRLSLNKKKTFERVMQTKSILEEYKIDYNILTVLTDEMAGYPEEIWEFIKNENIRYIQFIPCLDNLEKEFKSEFALKPENFAYFYKKLFPLWEDEWRKGNYYSISFFDNIISLIGEGKVGSCSLIGECTPQYVVEGNGNVYPCDFYVLDEYYLGNLQDSTLEEIFYSKNLINFLNSNNSISKFCENCFYLSICNGGCKRLKRNMYLNNSEDYCGYKDFLDSQGKALIRVIKDSVL